MTISTQGGRVAKLNKPPPSTQVMSTGRPKNHTIDNMSKICAGCRKRFWLRDQPFVSRNRFAKRRYCSAACSPTQNKDLGEQWAKDRFFAKVEKTRKCWNWQGATFRNGYGSFNANNKKVRAHRYSYETIVGPIPEGKMLLHSCDNRRCVNPQHLRPGTAKENAQDAISRNRAAFQKKHGN